MNLQSKRLSTDLVTSPKSGGAGGYRLVGRESTREGCQRTLSRIRGWERMPFGWARVHAGGAVNGLFHGLTDSNGCCLAGRESTRGGCQRTLSRIRGWERMPFGWVRVHAGGISWKGHLDISINSGIITA